MSSDPASSPPLSTIRHDLRSGDLGAILTLHGTFYSQESGYDLTFEGYVARTLAHFAQPYDLQRERVWLAEVGARLVGCIAILKHTDEQAQLRWFLVDPMMRGQGLGRRLLEEALRFVKERGYASVFLETVEDLPASAYLYRSVGFVLTEEQKRILWGKEIIEQRYELAL